MKRIYSALLLIIFLFISVHADAAVFAPLPNSVQQTDTPNITATSAMVIDTVTNTILYSKNPDAKIFPASTSKIMTALLVLEKIQDLKNTLVTVSAKAVAVPSDTSRMGLQKNDKVSAFHLLYGVMLPSGADATIALAEQISGSLEAFIALMNQRAAELGMAHTHFTNTHGLNNPDHYTTAYDMALLTLECLKHPELIAVSSTYSHDVVLQRGGQSIQFAIKNTNALLNSSNPYYYEGVKGLKTGSTAAAGECLITYYEKEDRKIVVLQFHSDYTRRFPEASTLLDYGIKHFETINLTDIFAKRNIVVQIANAQKDDEYNGQLPLKLTNLLPKYYTTTTELATAIKNYTEPLVMEIPADVQAPVYTGDIIGKVTFKIGDEILYSGEAAATRTIYPHIDIPADMKVIPNVDQTPAVIRVLQNKLLWAVVFILIAGVAVLFITLSIRRARMARMSMRKSSVYSRRRFRN